MSTTLDLQGRSLAETLGELQQRVRQSPQDAKLRVFLFQLLAVLGQWERALGQLGVAGELDAGALAMVHMYRDAVQAEALRVEVFAGRRTPVVLGEPDPWVARMLQALELSGQGKHGPAAELRTQALEEAPAVAGRIVTGVKGNEGDTEGSETSTPFAWIADADVRMGPLVEAVVLGRYWWIPFARIRRMHLEPPTDLRDLVWTPVHFEWTNGGEGYGLVPARYPGSEAHEDDALRLGRRTEWKEVAEDAWHGLGQRMLATDGGEWPWLDVRRVEFDVPADTGAA